MQRLSKGIFDKDAGKYEGRALLNNFSRILAKWKDSALSVSISSPPHILILSQQKAQELMMLRWLQSLQLQLTKDRRRFQQKDEELINDA